MSEPTFKVLDKDRLTEKLILHTESSKLLGVGKYKPYYEEFLSISHLLEHLSRIQVKEKGDYPLVRYDYKDTPIEKCIGENIGKIEVETGIEDKLGYEKIVLNIEKPFYLDDGIEVPISKVTVKAYLYDKGEKPVAYHYASIDQNLVKFGKGRIDDVLKELATREAIYRSDVSTKGEHSFVRNMISDWKNKKLPLGHIPLIEDGTYIIGPEIAFDTAVTKDGIINLDLMERSFFDAKDDFMKKIRLKMDTEGMYHAPLLGRERLYKAIMSIIMPLKYFVKEGIEIRYLP